MYSRRLRWGGGVGSHLQCRVHMHMQGFGNTCLCGCSCFLTVFIVIPMSTLSVKCERLWIYVVSSLFIYWAPGRAGPRELVMIQRFGYWTKLSHKKYKQIPEDSFYWYIFDFFSFYVYNVKYIQLTKCCSHPNFNQATQTLKNLHTQTATEF